MRNLLLLSTLVFLALNGISQTISDVDGNTYNTVTIGTQLWMKENLRTTRLNDSTAIPNITGASAWSGNRSPAYCTYNNTTNTDTITRYGLLYNWYTVGTKKLCPAGWHVPTDEEWTTLTTYLGGDDVAGIKLKDIGSNYWKNSNTKGVNSSGFTALPGGIRYVAGDFSGFGTDAFFITSNKDLIGSIPCIYIRQLFYNEKSFVRHPVGLVNGMSVRCLSDEPVNVGISNISNKKLIYPNPVKESLFIQNSTSTNSQVIICDSQGRQVFAGTIVENQIDVSLLSKGIYLVKIIDQGRVTVEKIMKE